MGEDIMVKILLVGAGNIGSRHLQALALLNRDAEITVVDQNEESLKVAKERFESVYQSDYKIQVSYIRDLQDAYTDADIAIVATSSGPRKAIVDALLENTTIKYYILEKVVFQSVEDLYDMKKKFDERGVKVWVNCPRRNMDFYKKLRKLLREESYVNYLIEGGDWGMGCNSIHLLDIYAYLSGASEFSADIERLDAGHINSKRSGYYEFSGQLDIDTNKGQVTMRSMKNRNAYLIATITSNHYQIIVDERRGTAWIRSEESGWDFKEKEFDMLYVSQTTKVNVEAILDKGDCDLTSYEESLNYHEVLINAFLNHLKKTDNYCENACPIT